MKLKDLIGEKSALEGALKASLAKLAKSDKDSFLRNHQEVEGIIDDLIQVKIKSLLFNLPGVKKESAAIYESIYKLPLAKQHLAVVNNLQTRKWFFGNGIDKTHKRGVLNGLRELIAVLEKELAIWNKRDV